MKLLLILFFLISGCAKFKALTTRTEKPENIKLEGYSEYETNDYIEHMNALKIPYLRSREIKKVNLRKSDIKYLEKIADTIITKNELFFKTSKIPNFFIVDSETPFHFSLPGMNIFMSSGLVKKYIKSEKLLYCLITYELIRTEKNLYKTNLIVPTGALSTRRMLSLLRLNIKEKVEVHKWAFYLLKRVDIDTDNYLSWLQIQNRNSVDFSLQLGDISSISREESLFKSFIIKNTKKKRRSQYEGSSKKFYTFVKNLKR
jgi:hypothetical protein